MASPRSKRPLPLTRQEEDAFLHEIEQQCRYVLLANGQFEAARAELARLGHRETWDGAAFARAMGLAWYAIQALVTAAANVSKLAGGQYGNAPERAELRNALGIERRSPVNNRNVRNATEHLDSRIRGVFGPGKHVAVFMNRNMAPRPKQPEVVAFLNYDAALGELSFAQHSLSLPELVDDVARIYGLLPALLERARTAGLGQ